MRVRTDLSVVSLVSLVSLLTACAKPTEVELRLLPCGTPVRVDLDVQGYDGDGQALAPLHASFAITDSGVFSDSYATVGLVKPDGMVTADFTVTWTGGDDVQQVVVATGMTVPDAGEVLTIEADGCMAVDDSTTDVPTSTGEPGTSTGAASTSTGTGTGSGSTGDDTTGDVSTTTTGSTGDVSTTGTTESADTSTGGSTGNDTMLGDACAPDGAYLCDGSGPGVVGQLLECKQGEWDTTACDLTDCPALGFPQYQVVGCSGEEIFGCICQADPGTNCIPADQGCDVDGMTMTLCLDGVLSKTVCAVCYEDPNGPYCGE